MAALRCATRRLGHCALQRLQAVYKASASTVMEGAQRRLLQTVASTSSRRVASSVAVAAKPHLVNTAKIPRAKSAARTQLDEKTEERLASTYLAKIQKKKEEIFSLITHMDSALPAHCTKVNKQLAMDLSAQVEPKPGDPQWRFYRGAKRAETFLMYAGMTYLSALAVYEGFQNCEVQTRAKDATEE